MEIHLLVACSLHNKSVKHHEQKIQMLLFHVGVVTDANLYRDHFPQKAERISLAKKKRTDVDERERVLSVQHISS